MTISRFACTAGAVLLIANLAVVVPGCHHQHPQPVDEQADTLWAHLNAQLYDGLNADSCYLSGIDPDYPPPSPFSPPPFQLGFGVCEAGNVVLTLTNMAGELVDTLVNSRHEQGVYSGALDVHGPSGVYFVEFSLNGRQMSRQKLVFVK